jgi:queuosine precursor transporter
MNEILFFVHAFLVAGASLFALRFGKSGLMALIGLESVLANIFVVKQVMLFGLHVTCSDVFIVGSLLSLNLLQEFYDREAAQKAVKISFFLMFFFMIMTKVHLLYAPSWHDHSQSAFVDIFSLTPRLVLASVIVYFFAQQLDLRLFGFLKSRFGEWPLALRTGISLVVSQTLDTALFSFLGLYGEVASIMDIMIMSLFIKALVIGCSIPFVAVSRRFARVI